MCFSPIQCQLVKSYQSKEVQLVAWIYGLCRNLSSSLSVLFQDCFIWYKLHILFEFFINLSCTPDKNGFTQNCLWHLNTKFFAEFKGEEYNTCSISPDLSPHPFFTKKDFNSTEKPPYKTYMYFSIFLPFICILYECNLISCLRAFSVWASAHESTHMCSGRFVGHRAE